MLHEKEAIIVSDTVAQSSKLNALLLICWKNEQSLKTAGKLSHREYLIIFRPSGNVEVKWYN